MGRVVGKKLRSTNQKNNRRARKFSGSNGLDGTVTPIVIWLFQESRICRYCGKDTPLKERTIDHMQPLSRGGCHSVMNLALACKECNQRKGNKTLIEFIIEEKYDSKCSSKKH